jgi:hypothetical protein
VGDFGCATNHGSENARVHVFASTDTLLNVAAKIYQTAAFMQLVIDSKHRVPMKNYPVTAVGLLNAGQLFNLVMLTVSNKEDEKKSTLSYRIYKMPSHHVP